MRKLPFDRKVTSFYHQWAFYRCLKACCLPVSRVPDQGHSYIITISNYVLIDKIYRLLFITFWFS